MTVFHYYTSKFFWGPVLFWTALILMGAASGFFLGFAGILFSVPMSVAMSILYCLWKDKVGLRGLL